MKLINYFLILLTFILFFNLVSSYVAPDYDSVYLNLTINYVAQEYNSVDLVLSDAETPSDTCSCPGLNNDWEVSLSDYCIITSDCNLGTGMLSFINNGNFTCDAIIKTTDLGDVGSANYLYINGGCTLNIL